MPQIYKRVSEFGHCIITDSHLRLNMKCILAFCVLACLVCLSWASSLHRDARNLRDCEIPDFVFCAGHGKCVTYKDPDNNSVWVHSCQCERCYHGAHCTQKTDLYDCMGLPTVLPEAADKAKQAEELLKQGVAPADVAGQLQAA